MKKRNPTELLIFGNPRRSRRRKNAGASYGNHKPGCKCAFCKRAAALVGAKKNPAGAVRIHWKIGPGGRSGTSEAKTTGQATKLIHELQREALSAGKQLSYTIEELGRNPAGYTHAIVMPGGAVLGSYKSESDARAELKRGKASGNYPPKAEVKPLTQKNPRRRNPTETEQAVELFQSFHGKDPRDVQEKQRSAAMRLDYAACGNLLELTVETPAGQKAVFGFEGDGVMLAAAPPDKDGKSRQLYCIGGNQNVSPCLDPDSLQKDLIDLGDCTHVVYLARKIHSKFEPVEWKHKFGEVSGELPRLAFDKIKKEIFFIGGAYFIDTSKGVSPGIEN